MLSPDFSGNLRHTGSAGGNRRDDGIVERRFPHFLLEQIFPALQTGRSWGFRNVFFNIVLNAQLIAHLKQILGRAADDAIHIGFLFIGEIF